MNIYIIEILKNKLNMLLVMFLLISCIKICHAEVDDSLKEYVIQSVENNESLFRNFDTKFSLTFLDVNGDQLHSEPGQDEIISKEEYHYIRENNKFYTNYTRTWDNNYAEQGIQVFNGKTMQYYREDINNGMIRAEKKFPTPVVADRFTNLYPDVRDMTMSEFLKASTIKDIQTCEIQGHKGFLVHLVHCDSTPESPLEQKIYFDAERGFVPVTVETYMINRSSEKPTLVAEVLEYTKVEDEIFFPKKAHIVGYFNTNEQGDITFSSDVMVDVSEVKVNTELPKDIFNYEFPMGADVYDEIADLHYIVGGTDKIVLSVENLVETNSNSEIPAEQHNDNNDTILTINNDPEITGRQTNKAENLQATLPIYYHWSFWVILILILVSMFFSYIIVNKRKA